MNILFICTHNRCRSILSEVIFNQLTSDNFQFYSAGSQPSGEVHPLSIKYLAQTQFDPSHAQSQRWDDFVDSDIDIAITVCDSAANEVCPIWMQNCIKLHWPLVDPSKVEGSDADKQAAFLHCIDTIKQRVALFMDMDLDNLQGAQLQQALSKLA